MSKRKSTGGEGGNVRVCARFRPPNKVELAEGGYDVVDYKSTESAGLQIPDGVCHLSLTSQCHDLSLKIRIRFATVHRVRDLESTITLTFPMNPRCRSWRCLEQPSRGFILRSPLL